MAFAILRTKKLKSMGAISRSARHTFREQLTPNADPALTSKNRTIGARGADQVLSAISGLLPEKRRKDAVLCIEYLITASPEAFKRHGGHLDDMGAGYFKDALKWLQKRHGKEYVVSSTIHLDEATPHLVAYVVPLTRDKRLSCKDFLGGPKKLREMQDDFHKACGASRGLDRGLKGSKATHQSLKRYYADLEKAGQAPKLTRADYAKAALGIHTKAWSDAQALIKATATAVMHQKKVEKSSRSRAKSLSRKEAELEEKSMSLGTQRLLLKAENERVKSESDQLDRVARELRGKLDYIESLEAEKAALERRLEVYEVREKNDLKGPRRALDSDPSDPRL